MKLSATLKGRKLSLRYVVENDRAGDLFLANAMQDWHNDPDGDPVTHLAYVNHGGDNRVVFFQGHVDGPPGIDATRARAPMYTRVAPGDRFEGEIRAKVPLLEWDAYQEPARLLAWPVMVQEIELRVDIRREPERIFDDPSSGGFVGVGGGTAEMLTATATLEEPVMLLRRVRSFRRFA